MRDAGFDLFGLGADVAEWEVLVDGLDGVAECGKDGGGGELGFYRVGDELLILGLAVEGVEGGRRITLQLIVFGVGGDADDLIDGFGVTLVYLAGEGFADGIRVRVGAVGEALVDDGDERGGGADG